MGIGSICTQTLSTHPPIYHPRLAPGWFIGRLRIRMAQGSVECSALLPSVRGFAVKWRAVHARANSCVTGLALQVASKIPEEDKSTLEKAIEEAISWLDANQLAEVRITSRLDAVLRYWAHSQLPMPRGLGKPLWMSTSVTLPGWSLGVPARQLLEARFGAVSFGNFQN